MTASLATAKRLGQVTIPSLSHKGIEDRYVRFLTELKISVQVEEEDDGRQAATTARVVSLEDGKEYDYIAPSLAVSALSKYPGGYVGKCFHIHVGRDVVPGKRYRPVECWEIECPKQVPGAAS